MNAIDPVTFRLVDRRGFLRIGAACSALGASGMAILPAGPALGAAAPDDRLLIRTIEGHSRHVWRVAMTPDGRRAISGSADKTARVWDLRTGKLQATLEHSNVVQSVAISPDGRFALTGAGSLIFGLGDNAAMLWSLETNQQVRSFLGHTGPVKAVAFVPDRE